jgi:hypothetical protein
VSTDAEREYLECAACQKAEGTRKCVGKECNRPLCQRCADMASLCPSCRVAAGLPDLRQLVLL